MRPRVASRLAQPAPAGSPRKIHTGQTQCGQYSYESPKIAIPWWVIAQDNFLIPIAGLISLMEAGRHDKLINAFIGEAAKIRESIMFGLFSKKDKPKVDAAEMERREREERKRELAEQLRKNLEAEKAAQKG